MNQTAVVALAFRRQHFLEPASPEEYDRLFRDYSPVPTIGWCEPGLPPTLPPHAAFDDGAYNGLRRAGRQILKGRFHNRLAYVAREDWELFACLYRKPLPALRYEQVKMLELLRQEGPLNIGLIKEMTGLLVKQITPILHRLQEAFLVFEDQQDNAGDRGWYCFEEVFPEVDFARYDKKGALCAVLPRFAHRQVFFTEEMARNFYGSSVREVREATQCLVEQGLLCPAELGGKKGFILAKDAPLLEDDAPLPAAIILLDRNDFLVRSHQQELKERFQSDWGVLYYLLVDGEIHGAVCGRFRFGPPEVEDIVLDLPGGQAEARRQEVLAAVYTRLDPAESPARRYQGKACGALPR